MIYSELLKADIVAFVNSWIPVGFPHPWLCGSMTAQAWATLSFAIGRVGEKAQKKLNAKKKSVGTCQTLEGTGQSHLELGSP